ncbi:YraN family protein, partial [Dysosmobacter welbionis]
GDAVQVRQIRGDIPQHLVHEPGVDIGAAGSLRDNVLSGSGAVREMQLLRLGGLGLLLCQIGEPGDAHIVIAAGHPGQDHLLALLVQLPGRDGAAVLPGDGDGGHGTIQGGVVGDGDEAGA